MKPVRHTSRRCKPNLEHLEDRTVPAHIDWTGAGDGYTYGDPNNWSTSTVPGTSDDAYVFPASPLSIVGGSASVHSLWTGSNTEVSFSGALTLGFRSTLMGDLEVEGQFTASSGMIVAMGSTDIGGGAVIGSGAWVQWIGGGSLDGNASLAANSTLRLGGGFTLEDGVTIAGSGVTQVVGQVTVEGVVTIDTILVQASDVTVATGGLLTLSGGGSVNGDYNLNANGEVHFTDETYDLTYGVSLTGDGWARVTGATLNIAGDVEADNLELTGTGAVSGSGTLTI